MSEHVHYDIDALEQRMRASASAMAAKAHSQAKSPDDHRFIELQLRFEETTRLATLAYARAINDGFDRTMIAKCVAICSATIDAQFIQSNRTHHLAISSFFDQRRQVLDILIVDGRTPDSVLVETESFAATPGGRA